jgi:hypothetical protein
MKRFNEFKIKPPARTFEGDKIKIAKILGREIIVYDFRIEDSKCFADRGSGKCLYLQITFNQEKRIVFTSAGALIEVIQQIPHEDFQFTTTIIQDNERFLFT